MLGDRPVQTCSVEGQNGEKQGEATNGTSVCAHWTQGTENNIRAWVIYTAAKAMQGKVLYAERRNAYAWNVYFAPNDYWVVHAECVELADPFRRALAKHKEGRKND
jgi:hypothetical protein